jgi:hypothetical protein
MTTIAYRNGVLAADTGAYINNGSVRVPGRGRKLYRLKDGSMAAGAGSRKDIQEMVRWLDGGDEPAKDNDAYLLHISTEFITYYEGTHVRDVEDCSFYALGSGAAAALGAMYAGADAYGAIEAAIAVDPYTDGEIDMMMMDPSPPAPGSFTDIDPRDFLVCPTTKLYRAYKKSQKPS